MMRNLTATYRLQFREGTDFDTAADLAPYLKRLGVSHLYASPIFSAASSSTHGYDVTDHQRFDPTLGGEAGFARLSEALEAAGLGLILDIVPNHMAASPENPWWRSVLEEGAASPHADYFDIDWAAPRIILPILGAPYAETLEKGDLGLARDAETGRLSLTYFDNSLPLNADAEARIAERLAGAEADSSALEALAGDRDFLHALHEAQAWRLAYWRLGRDGLTYRRFFEITELVGVRVEQQDVFDAVHRLILALVADGKVDGLRVDHVDGLADPKAYLNQLAAAVDGRARIFVEKILEGQEALRPDWPIEGTSGYEFITALANLLTDPDGETAFEAAYRQFLEGEKPDVAQMRIKAMILTNNLAGELEGLLQIAARMAAADLTARDYGADTLRRALTALIIAFPVYRTYIDDAGASDADRTVIAEAVAAAKSTPLLEDPAPIDLIARYLTGEVPPDLEIDARDFTTRFQQTTGPVMAKAIEDTLFYRDARLIGLNEVGGDPRCFGAPMEAFHATVAERARSQPGGLSATATHDTKRGEDARTRLYALSEQPDAWADIVSRISAGARRFRVDLPQGPAPGRAVEWKIYQAIFAAWPTILAPEDAAGLAEFSSRVDQYLEKALREAKSRTTWTAPDTDYEKAVREFAARLLDPGTGLPDEMARLFAPFWTAGALNSLSQALLKMAAPGVPDIYQGTEQWDFSFVDPDNRRPVDFSALARAAEHMEPAATLLDEWRSGAVKQKVLMAGLAARATAPRLFSEGDYQPLTATGRRAENVVAFCRRHGESRALVVAPVRAGAGIRGDVPTLDADYWEDTTLSPGPDLTGRILRDVITDRAWTLPAELEIKTLLTDFPVALLVASDR